MVRLSAGREQMPEAIQSLCFLAGANSIFYGEKLLTTTNPEAEADRQLFERLGIHPKQESETFASAEQQPSTAAMPRQSLWHDAMQVS